MGVLWRHSSVNLVKPRSIALAGPNLPRQLPEIALRLASWVRSRNRRNSHAQCSFLVEMCQFRALQFPINQIRVIEALGVQ